MLVRLKYVTDSGGQHKAWKGTQDLGHIASTPIRSRRVCVLHGKPMTTPRSEVDADHPSDLPELRSEGQIDTMPNILAMIKLTGFLEEARDKMWVFCSFSECIISHGLQILSTKSAQGPEGISAHSYIAAWRRSRRVLERPTDGKILQRLDNE